MEYKCFREKTLQLWPLDFEPMAKLAKWAALSLEVGVIWDALPNISHSELK